MNASEWDRCKAEFRACAPDHIVRTSASRRDGFCYIRIRSKTVDQPLALGVFALAERWRADYTRVWHGLWPMTTVRFPMVGPGWSR